MSSNKDHSRAEKLADSPIVSVDSLTGSVGALNLDGAVGGHEELRATGHDQSSNQSQETMPNVVESTRKMRMLENKLNNLEKTITESVLLVTGDASLETPEGESDMEEMLNEAMNGMGEMEALAWKFAQQNEKLMKLFQSKEEMLKRAESKLKAEERSHQATKKELMEVNELLKGANGNVIKLQEVMQEHHDLKKRFSAVKEAMNFWLGDCSVSHNVEFDETAEQDSGTHETLDMKEANHERDSVSEDCEQQNVFDLSIATMSEFTECKTTGEQLRLLAMKLKEKDAKLEEKKKDFDLLEEFAVQQEGEKELLEQEIQKQLAINEDLKSKIPVEDNSAPKVRNEGGLENVGVGRSKNSSLHQDIPRGYCYGTLRLLAMSYYNLRNAYFFDPKVAAREIMAMVIGNTSTAEVWEQQLNNALRYAPKAQPLFIGKDGEYELDKSRVTTFLRNNKECFQTAKSILHENSILYRSLIDIEKKWKERGSGKEGKDLERQLFPDHAPMETSSRNAEEISRDIDEEIELSEDSEEEFGVE